MGTTFTLPDLGEGLTEADLVAWHVDVGDRVVAGQPLCSVETDKAVIEVPSPQSGQISEIFAAPGDVVQVGNPLVSFDGETATARARSAGSVLTLPEAQPESQRPAAASASPAANRRPAAAPAVRRLAEKLGVDLGRLAGSGPYGAITTADVEAARPATAGQLAAAGQQRRLRGVRRAMRLNMERAGREVVPATITDEADVDLWSDDQDTSVRLIRAIVAACRASPNLNAWFDADSDTLRLHERVDLAIAVESADGLFAPVIRDAASHDTDALRKALERIKEDVAQRSIPRAELTGATFTLSNFGMFGGRFANLVVMPPQVAILGAGRARVRAVERDGEPCMHRLLPLSLSFDHRVVTGIEALRFLNAVIDDLQEP